MTTKKNAPKTSKPPLKVTKGKDAAPEPEPMAVVPAADNFGALSMVVHGAAITKRYGDIQLFIKEHLVPGRDYGNVQGISRPFLLQPGAENLGIVFALRPEFECIERDFDLDRDPPFVAYGWKCRLYSQGTDIVRGEGVGFANSWEKKYRWRRKAFVCPTCGGGPFIKGKEEFGGGWLCWSKKGGCGAKFPDNDPAVIEMRQGEEVNLDTADLHNTIGKMSKKRSFVDAIKAATGTSGLFTQDPDAVQGYVDADEDLSASGGPGDMGDGRAPDAQGDVPFPETSETEAGPGKVPEEELWPPDSRSTEDNVRDRAGNGSAAHAPSGDKAEEGMTDEEKTEAVKQENGGSSGTKISDASRKLVFKFLGQRGISAAVFKKECLIPRYKVQRIDDLPQDAASDVLQFIAQKWDPQSKGGRGNGKA